MPNDSTTSQSTAQNTVGSELAVFVSHMRCGQDSGPTRRRVAYAPRSVWQHLTRALPPLPLHAVMAQLTISCCQIKTQPCAAVPNASRFACGVHRGVVDRLQQLTHLGARVSVTAPSRATEHAPSGLQHHHAGSRGTKRGCECTLLHHITPAG